MEAQLKNILFLSIFLFTIPVLSYSEENNVSANYMKGIEEIGVDLKYIEGDFQRKANIQSLKINELTMRIKNLEFIIKKMNERIIKLEYGAFQK
jgi:ppGpp synthetase/RelA/SpoT-type nucleotidyltranferase